MEVMKKRLLVIALVFGMATLFIAAGLYAGTDLADEIKMENKAYSKHKKGIVTFSHKKHMDEYAKQFPDFYKNGCGDCHHDKDNKPLALKVGDYVQPCIECHKKPVKDPRERVRQNFQKKSVWPTMPRRCITTARIVIKT